jgi:hypothetical protein
MQNENSTRARFKPRATIAACRALVSRRLLWYRIKKRGVDV